MACAFESFWKRIFMLPADVFMASSLRRTPQGSLIN